MIENNPRFRKALLETIPCAVVVLDSERRIIYWNRSAELLTGYGSQEVIGSSCEVIQTRLRPDADPEMLAALCPMQNLDQQFDEECEIRHKSGRAIPIVRKTQPVTDDEGKPIGAVVAMVDVSVLKKARSEIRMLRDQVARSGRFGRIVGSSREMQKLYEAIEMVADTDASVVIEGETGTGKELIARTLHEKSSRAENPFLPVNCGALPETLIEAELFGHVKGAFTGASADRAGRFEQASGGTLFLDEVGELPLSAQVKLLRVLQEREITRVGESLARPVDVRIVAATNRDLSAMVAEDRFREDLFYRLRVVGMHVPPLRDRHGDLTELVAYFVDKFNRKYERTIDGCSAEMMRRLESCDWPGNVRQLEHAIEHAFVVTPASRRQLEADALPPEVQESGSRREGPRRGPPAPAPVDKPADEREKVMQALRATEGNKAAAARAMGITRAGLYKKLKRLGIDASAE